MKENFPGFQARSLKAAFDKPRPPRQRRGGPPMSRPEQKAALEKRMYALGGHFDLKKLEGYGRKQTNSLIEAGKTAMIFSVFTEKRKNAGLSLKSCAEYTKINGKFNRGFTVPRPGIRERSRERSPDGSSPRNPWQNRSGARAGPCAPFWSLQKGSTLHFPAGAGLPFSDGRGFIPAKCESAPPAADLWSIAAAVLSKREGRTAVRDKYFKEEELI